MLMEGKLAIEGFIHLLTCSIQDHFMTEALESNLAWLYRVSTRQRKLVINELLRLLSDFEGMFEYDQAGANELKPYSRT
jgi:hypothetical protein